MSYSNDDLLDFADDLMFTAPTAPSNTETNQIKQTTTTKLNDKANNGDHDIFAFDVDNGDIGTDINAHLKDAVMDDSEDSNQSTTTTTTTTTSTNNINNGALNRSKISLTKPSVNNNNNTKSTANNNNNNNNRKLPTWMGSKGTNNNSNNDSNHSSNNSNTDNNIIHQSEAKRKKKEDATNSYKGNNNNNSNLDEGDRESIETWLKNLRGFKEIDDPIQSGRVICFDLETTGFTVDDSIIEIGAVELIDGCRTGLTFQSYARPKALIHPLAQEVHQLSNYLLNSSPPIEYVLASFLDFVGDSVLVAHNLAFDHRMLVQEIIRSNIPINHNIQCFCTMKYYRRLYKEVNYSLDSISQQLKINKLLLRRTHGALVDSEILAILYCHILSLPSNLASIKISNKVIQLNQITPQSNNNNQNNQNNNQITIVDEKVDLNNVYKHDQKFNNQSNPQSNNINNQNNQNNNNQNTNNGICIVKSIDHIVLTTKDIDKCITFYTKVIGLSKQEFGVNGSRVALKYGEQKINIHEYGKEITPHATMPVPGSLDICFVASVPLIKVIERMVLNGVEMLEGGIVSRTGALGPILSIYIRDPDGNLIEISEYQSNKPS